ncbi:MAG TPA: hypothetical protein VN408_16840, partial [Actinoplanes sp.]|nr:hypothetical protein [Actinoplanes sp.]
RWVVDQDLDKEWPEGVVSQPGDCARCGSGQEKGSLRPAWYSAGQATPADHGTHPGGGAAPGGSCCRVGAVVSA